MPYIAFETVTSMRKKEVVENLEAALTKANWIGRPKEPKPFFGSVSGSNFKMIRVISGRDSFNPMIYGHFWETGQRTHVRIRMTFHPLVWAFLIVYSVLLGSELLAAFFGNVGNTIIILFLMLLFPWLLGVPLFYYNASKSKRLLQERFRLVEVTKGDATDE